MEQRPLLKDYKELPTGKEKLSPKRKDLAVTLPGGSHVQADGPLGHLSDLARLTLSPDNKKKQGAISTIIREPTHTPTEAESSISALTRHTIEEVDEDGYLIVKHPIEQDYHLVTKVERSVPNNLDAYRKEIILEGYLPVPPQNLWDRLCNYYSSNRQKAETLIKIKEIEDNRDRYKANLNKESIGEIELAIEIAKHLFEPDIQRTERYLKNIKNTISDKEYKEIKEKKFKEFKESIIKCSSEILERFSGNADRANEVFVSELESLSKKQSKQPQLIKLNSIIKMGGFRIR